MFVDDAKYLVVEGLVDTNTLDHLLDGLNQKNTHKIKQVLLFTDPVNQVGHVMIYYIKASQSIK